MDFETVYFVLNIAPLIVVGILAWHIFFYNPKRITFEDHEKLREFIQHEINMHLFEKQQDKLFTSMNDIIFERDKE